MNRFRTHWLALVGAMLLLGLSVSSAFGAHPDHADNRGNAVSTFVHELLFGSDEESEEEQEEEEEEGDEDTDEDETSEDEDTEETDEESEESEFKNHGHCVREVAWSLEVGGMNENHGGAVSEAARVTCSSDGEDEEDGEEGTENEEEAVEETETTAKDRGRSADAHANAPGKNKAEGARGGGNGHGRWNR